MAPQQTEITISAPVTDEDFLGLATVENRAFSGSPLLDLCFGTGDHDAFNAAKHHRIALTDPTARYLVARLPSGKIVGMAKWNFFLEEPPRDQFPWPLDFAPGANLELSKLFFGELDQKRNREMKGRKHFLMGILVVDPDYQRMGVGKKLLDWGLSQADRDGIPVWIDATPKGKGLYEQVGWKQVDFVDIDLSKWGGEDEVERTVNMLREPRKRD